MLELRRAIFVRVIAVALLLSLVYTSMAGAQLYQSSNYRLDEAAVDGGGLSDSASANFQGRGAIGDIGVGEANSTNFQVAAGTVTTNEPNLSFQMVNANANFDPFSPSLTSTATATFRVLNYTSHGYVVQIAGTPPQNGGKTIPALATNSASIAGTEQFGMNIVANTTPAVGTNPDNGQFGFGEAAPSYDTANSFRYVSGETIALAPKSSGITTYTISFIVNVEPLTPGGLYTSNQTLVITGTY